jgi:catechol 2,3-dioxygenase-like lactoylglutathione lyase family enzyme
MYKLDHLGLVVKEMEPAVRFYQKLGFTIARESFIEAAHLHLAYLEQGGLTLELLCDGSGKSGGLGHFALSCDRIESLYEDLRQAGVTLLHQQVQVQENLKFFFAQGAAGEWLEFVEEGEAR